MKKENIKRLLTEMIDREFDTDEIADVFCHIDKYLFSIRESKRKEEADYYRDFWRSQIDYYRKWLKEKLEDYSLDYTIQEIEE